ncbi:hypothetical protein FBUS_06276 [Fasciolopsis buskii]|uniref:Seipin n=1 Tax=Fasciolopsis buskii TaxID=27845 RepID=A0A8E0RN53_9TREM|nr:hypothetical protein FBUS_06276 [Fasciolopsis buski]
MRVNNAPDWFKRWIIFSSFELLVLLGCAASCALLRFFIIPNIVWEEEVSPTYNNSCLSSKKSANNMCDFPSTEVVLADGGALTPGYPYTCTAELYIPDSPRNHAAGVNTLNLDLLDVNRTLVAQFRKSFAVPYRSTLVRLVNRLVLMPLLITRMIDEELHVVVKLASNYKDLGLTRYGRLTLESHDLVWSRMYLRFHAQLTSVGSWMYYWPISSFLTVVSLFFVCAHIFLLVIFIRFQRRKNSGKVN